MSDRTRPLHVLHVIDSMSVGGAQRHLLELTTELVAMGHSCSVATAGDGALEPEFSRRGIAVHVMTSQPVSRRLSPGFAVSLSRLAGALRVDLIHAHLHASSVAAAVAATAHRLPLVTTQHSDGVWQRPHHRAFGWFAARAAVTRIAVARSLMADTRTVHIPNGVRISPQPANRRAQREARAHLGVPVDAFLPAFIGRLTEDKDPLLFVDAAVRVAAESPSAHFLVVGDGPLRGQVRARIGKYGLGHRFTMTGFLADASIAIAAADLVALTSRRDACPLVPLEAMAAGQPVVATAVGDVPLQVRDGETGYVVSPGDVEAVAQAMRSLEVAARRERFGAVGRDHVRHAYSLQHMVWQTLAVYVEALAGAEGDHQTVGQRGVAALPQPKMRLRPH